MPADLAGRFAEHFNNPELLSLRDDIAMLRVRVGELLPQLDGEEAEQKAAWRELARLLTRISGLVMRESRMVARARMYLTLPEAQSLVVALSTAVRDEVTDPAALGRILTRFRALATRQHCIGIDAKPSTPTPAPSGACDHATL